MSIIMDVLSKVKNSSYHNLVESTALPKRASNSSLIKSRFWFPLHISQRKILLIIMDVILLNLALMLGLHFYQSMPLYYTITTLQPVWFITLTLVWLTIASADDNYRVERADSVFSSIFGIIKTLLMTGLIYNLLPFLTPSLLEEPLLNLLIGILTFGMIVIWRIFYITVLLQPIFQRRFLIEGTGRAGRIIAQAIKEHNSSYEIIGYVNGKAPKPAHKLKEIYVSEKWENLTQFVKDHNISDIVITTPRKMSNEQLHALLKCFENGVRIIPMPVLYEEITNRIPVKYIHKEGLALLPIDWDAKRLYAIVKRAMDIFIAGLGLFILAPSFLVLALAINLDSSGPIFYRPIRLGRGGKPFRLWKFRTMVPNADKIGDPTFTARNDQRITRIGQILRLTHLDELPQFINILNGDMSLVGPRPERHVPELEKYIPYYRIRNAVKPGAIGWALVKQGYAEGIENTLIKLQYDLYYIKHQSLLLDLRIICKSIVHMLTMRGR